MKSKIDITTSKIFNNEENTVLFKNLQIELHMFLCNFLNYSYEDFVINENRRFRKYIEIKHASRYILSKAGLKLTEISRLYNCDHTTVIHSIQFTESLINTDVNIKSIKKELLQNKAFKRLCLKILIAYTKVAFVKFIVVRKGAIKYNLYLQYMDLIDLRYTESLERSLKFKSKKDLREFLIKNNKEVKNFKIKKIYVQPRKSSGISFSFPTVNFQ